MIGDIGQLLRAVPFEPFTMGITNREKSLLGCSGLNVTIVEIDVTRPEADHWPFEPNGFIMLSGKGKLLLARPHGYGPATVPTPLRPPELPTTISVLCTRLSPPSKLRREIDSILKKVGIDITNKSFVASADPPVK